MDRNFEKTFYEKLEKKKFRVAMSITSSIVRSILVLMPTLLMRNVYNSLELGLDARGVVGIILLTLVIPIIVGASFSLDIRLGKYIYVIIKEIRIQAIANIVKQKLRTISKQEKGNLFQRIIVSLEELGDYYYWFLNTTTWYISTSVVGIALMLVINVKITLVLLVFTTSQIGCSFVIKNRIEKAEEMENQLQAKGSDYIMRITSHSAFIKTALLDGNELQYEKEWEKDSWKVYRAGIVNRQIVNSLSFILNLIRTLYLFFAVHYLFLSNGMLKGDFIALNSYIVWLTPVFSDLQGCVEDIIKSRENKRRVSAYLKEDMQTECIQVIVPDSALDKLEVSHLSFAYEDSKNEILSDLSFQVEKGETLYIIGASGCGKSTLLNVLQGLEHDYEGQILYNDYELRMLDDSWLHQNVVMVGQDVDILPTTLRENIFYSGVQATDEEVVEILHSLKIEYLLDMPGGLDWDMKKVPRALSDGEKKRIAIARAILSKPQVLLLDEPTAGLDNINKMSVARFIEQKIEGMLLVVTHDRVFPEGAKILYLGE